MDFLTAAAYAAILVLVIVNALIVRRMKIVIRGEDEAPPPAKEGAEGE